MQRLLCRSSHINFLFLGLGVAIPALFPSPGHSQVCSPTSELVTEVFGGAYWIESPQNHISVTIGPEELPVGLFTSGLEMIRIPHFFSVGPVSGYIPFEFRWDHRPEIQAIRGMQNQTPEEEGDPEEQRRALAEEMGMDYDNMSAEDWVNLLRAESDMRGRSFSWSMDPVMGRRTPVAPCAGGNSYHGFVAFAPTQLRAAVIRDTRVRGNALCGIIVIGWFCDEWRWRNEGIEFRALPAEVTSSHFPVARFAVSNAARAEELADRLYQTGQTSSMQGGLETYEVVANMHIRRTEHRVSEDEVTVNYSRTLTGRIRKQTYWDPRVTYLGDQWYEVPVRFEESDPDSILLKDRYVTTVDRYETDFQARSTMSFTLDTEELALFEQRMLALCGSVDQCGSLSLPSGMDELTYASQIPGPDQLERLHEMCDNMGEVGECFSAQNELLPDVEEDAGRTHEALTEYGDTPIGMSDESRTAIRSGRVMGTDEFGRDQRYSSHLEQVCTGQIEAEAGRRRRMAKDPSMWPEPTYPIECPEVIWPESCAELREIDGDYNVWWPIHVHLIRANPDAPPLTEVFINDARLSFDSEGVARTSVDRLISPVNVRLPVPRDPELGNDGLGRLQVYYFSFDAICHPAVGDPALRRTLPEFIDFDNPELMATLSIPEIAATLRQLTQDGARHPGPLATLEEGGGAIVRVRFGQGYAPFSGQFSAPHGGPVNIFVVDYGHPAPDA